MAECLLENPHAVTKVNCGEFQDAHEISKLIGSPPGYLGHRETHPLLSQEELDRHFTAHVQISLLLFDEIEKASDTLWNLLLGILDKGSLTLGDNRKIDFSRAMIFMTSNLGAVEMSAMLSPKVGFAVQISTPAGNDGLDGGIRRSAEDAARRKFTPEFINRLDKIVTFQPLGTNQLRQILDIELHMIQERIFRASPERSFVFTASNPAKELLLREGTDTRYGARHLKRTIEQLLVQPISNLIATEQVREGDCVRVDFNKPQGGLSFTRELEGLGSRAMTELVGVTLPVETVGASGSVKLDVSKTWKHAFWW